jgi:hypothetical protein
MRGKGPHQAASKGGGYERWSKNENQTSGAGRESRWGPAYGQTPEQNIKRRRSPTPTDRLKKAKRTEDRQFSLGSGANSTSSKCYSPPNTSESLSLDKDLDLSKYKTKLAKELKQKLKDLHQFEIEAAALNAKLANNTPSPSPPSQRTKNLNHRPHAQRTSDPNKS